MSGRPGAGICSLIQGYDDLGKWIEAACVVYIISLLTNMSVGVLSRYGSIVFSLYDSPVRGLIIIIRHFDSQLSLLTSSSSDTKKITAALLYETPPTMKLYSHPPKHYIINPHKERQ